MVDWMYEWCVVIESCCFFWVIVEIDGCVEIKY